MLISASVESEFNQHKIEVQTNTDSKTIIIAPKPNGYGSSVNGAELLLLALATCCCNDIYREAGKRNVSISAVKVTCEGKFGGEGETGTNFRYKVNVVSDAPAEAIEDLIFYVDKIAEVHNTLRKGISISLEK